MTSIERISKSVFNYQRLRAIVVRNVQTTRLVVNMFQKKEKKKKKTNRTTTTTENRHNQPKNVSPLYNYVTCKYRHMIYIAIEIQQFITTGKDSERENPPRVCVCEDIYIYIFKFFLKLFLQRESEMSEIDHYLNLSSITGGLNGDCSC